MEKLIDILNKVEDKSKPVHILERDMSKEEVDNYYNNPNDFTLTLLYGF